MQLASPTVRPVSTKDSTQRRAIAGNVVAETAQLLDGSALIYESVECLSLGNKLNIANWRRDSDVMIRPTGSE